MLIEIIQHNKSEITIYLTIPKDQCRINLKQRQQVSNNNQLNSNNPNFYQEGLHNQPFPRLYNQYEYQEQIVNNNNQNIPNYQRSNNIYESRSVRSTDKIFKNSYEYAVSQLGYFNVYQIFKVLYLIIFFITYHVMHKFEKPFLIIYIACALNCLIYISVYSMNLRTIKNLQKAILIAKNLGHDEQLAIRSDNKIELGLSEIYDKVNEQNNYLNDQDKKLKQEILKTQILHQVKKMTNMCSSLQKICDAISIFTIIALITCLSILKSNPPLLGCTIFYIVIQFISKIHFFGITIFLILVLALSPLICLGFCIYGCYLCCCSGRFNYRFLPPPEFPSQKYNPRMNLQTSQCAICLQTFVLDDDFIRLPCNKNHIFHKFCIESWLKMRTHCPLCRRQLTDDMNQNNN